MKCLTAQLDVPIVSRTSVSGHYRSLKCFDGARLPGAFNIPGGLWPCAVSDGVGNTVVRGLRPSIWFVFHEVVASA